VIPLLVPVPADRPLRLVALGAHPDDIEIGAGGTLLEIARGYPGAEVHYAVMTGTPERHNEARAAVAAFLPGADVTVELHDLVEGRLPVEWGQVKEIVEGVARGFAADIVLAPSVTDAHQDHRTIAEIVPTVFRDSLYLAYEIPKWDGDIGRPSVYVGLTPDAMRRKVELLSASFPSQKPRDWWDDETFRGLARIRGMECRQPYAEAFGCGKAVLCWSSDRIAS
jgi:LmbE family N-acetylglucosaminyl deacetylase